MLSPNESLDRRNNHALAMPAPTPSLPVDCPPPFEPATPEQMNALARAADKPEPAALRDALAALPPLTRLVELRWILALSFRTFSVQEFSDASRRRQADLNAREKLAALAEKSVVGAWDVDAPRGGWSEAAARMGWFRCLAWMLERDVGFENGCSSEAIFALVSQATADDIDESLAMIPQLMPRAKLTGARALLPAIVKRIQEHRPSSTVSHIRAYDLQRHETRIALADCVAAQSIGQPGVGMLLKLLSGDDAKLPRVTAAREAREIQAAVDQAREARDAGEASANARSDQPARRASPRI